MARNVVFWHDFGWVTECKVEKKEEAVTEQIRWVQSTPTPKG